MHLEDLPLDIGYASEAVSLKDTEGNIYMVGGQNGKTQLIITTPFINEQFTQELRAINEMLPQGGDYEVTAALVVANGSHKNPDLDRFVFLIDSDKEFGDFYATRLEGEPFGSEFAKALIVVSKDGAIFYDEFYAIALNGMVQRGET
jgi:peroxiredoxin